MTKLLRYLNNYVTEEDGSKSVAKIVVTGALGVAGVAAATYVSYQAYSYFLPSRKNRVNSQDETSKSQEDEPKDSVNTTSGETVEENFVEKAMALKEEGNKQFKAKKFEEAKSFYTQAISTCPVHENKTLAIFYQNRAAANECLQMWADVVDDCDSALSRDDQYQKAYSRRGKAKLALKQYQEAVEDTAAGFYLQDKKSKPIQDLFEQALTEKSKVDVAAFFQDRKPVLVGEITVKSYTGNFKYDPVLNNVEKLGTAVDGQECTPFQRACMNVATKKYNDVLEYLDEELLNDDSAYIDESLLLRATFRTLGGLPSESESDLDKLVVRENVDAKLLSTAFLRRALIKVAKMDSTGGLADMLEAEKVDPNNRDIFHHRGQIALLMQDFDQCNRDTEKAMTLMEDGATNPTLLFQKYMCDLQAAQFKQEPINFGETVAAMARICEENPTDGECWCLYAQALIYFGQTEQADAVYEKASLACRSPTLYIQRASMSISCQRDFGKALVYLDKAIELDETYEVAYENKAILHLQRGDYTEALKNFELQLTYSRTEIDIQNTMIMISSIKAQHLMKSKFGLTVPNVFNVS